MKRVFGCGLMTTLLGTVLLIGVVWSFRCYQSWIRQEIGLEADWTEIETSCLQQENLVSTLTVSLETLDPGLAGLDELKRANSAASLLVLSPAILHENGRLEEFIDVQQELHRRLTDVVGAIRHDAGLARQPTLDRLVGRLGECHERIAVAIDRFNGKAGSFNRRLTTFPDSVVAELAGLRRIPLLPPVSPVGEAREGAAGVP